MPLSLLFFHQWPIHRQGKNFILLIDMLSNYHLLNRRTAVNLTRRLGSSVIFATTAATAGAAWADPSPALDRISVSGGAFLASPEMKLGVDTSDGRINTPEQKPSHVKVPRIQADVLLGDSQGISFDYYRYSKGYRPVIAGSKVLAGQEIGGTAALDAKLQLNLASGAYKWWIGSGNDVIGLGAGVAYYGVKLKASGTAQVQDVSVSGEYSEKVSAYAPLFEMGWRHAFSQDLRLYADASGIKKNGGRINGHIYRGAVGVEWFLAKNIGLTLDYGISKISINSEGKRAAGIDVNLKGPSAFVKVRF